MAPESVATCPDTDDLAAKTNELIADLCNAKCMLDVTIKAHSEIVVDSDEWEVNEAMRGISTLLQGCYDKLLVMQENQRRTSP